MKFCVLYIYLILCSVTISSQIDTTYIKKTEHSLALRPYISQEFLLLKQSVENGKELEFKPNIEPAVGLGISLNNTIISLGYGYSLNFMKDEKYGNTKSFDFQLHHYGRMFVYDIFIQRYKGFYEDDTDNDIILYPDMKVHQYSIYGQYIFNNKKFSYRAAFDKAEKQLKSAGTFLIGLGIDKTKISSDSSFIFNRENRFTSFQIGISGGYAYSWIIDSHWDVSFSATVGVNLGNRNFREFAQHKMDVIPKALPRLSAGYTRESWSINFSALSNITFPSLSEKESLMVASGAIQISFIKRFNIIPFIGKKGNRFVDDVKKVNFF